MKKRLYPSEAEVEKIKDDIKANAQVDEIPDFVYGKPNYDKFAGWPVEKVLVWLNID